MRYQGIARVGVALALGALAGCDETDFGSEERVEELRILGLQSSATLVEPGDPLTLSALWVDAAPSEDGEVISAWFRGCVNPEFSSLGACLDDLNHLKPASGADWPPGFSPIPGDQVDLQVSASLLEGRSEPGSEYFFFAVCKGERFVFAPSADDTIPLQCRSPGGEAVAQPDFRVGFRTVTGVPGFSVKPQLPVITGFDIGGQTYAPDCVGDACVGYQRANCEGACPKMTASTCDDKDSPDKCDGTKFRVLVDEASAGLDWINKGSSGPQSVDVHAEYFVTAGEVRQRSDLLHESEPLGEQKRWDRESQASLKFEGSGALFLWAVVYDSVGGVTWAGITLEISG